MLLNGITCDGWTFTGKDTVEFSLSGTTIAEASALDGEALTLTLDEDEGAEVQATFTGYAVTGVYLSGESVRLRAARQLSTTAEQAVADVETKLAAAQSASDAADADMMQAIGELGVGQTALMQAQTEILQAVGELGAMVAAASAPAEDTADSTDSTDENA